MCHFQLWWIIYEASTHHWITDRISTDKLNFLCFVPFSYFNKRFRLPHSSLSGFLTLVVKNSTAIWISLLPLYEINNNCSFEWRQSLAYSSGRKSADGSSSSLTWNRCSADGNVSECTIYSVKAFKIFFTYFIIDIFTFTSSE